MDSFIVKIKDDNNIIYWFGKADNKDEAKSFVLEEYKNKPKFIDVTNMTNTILLFMNMNIEDTDILLQILEMDIQKQWQHNIIMNKTELMK